MVVKVKFSGFAQGGIVTNTIGSVHSQVPLGE